MTDITRQIEMRLEILDPVYMELTDESSLHLGHVGNTGGKHYKLFIVSEIFCGKSRVERQRLITTLLQAFFSEKIHAFSIKALTKTEYYS